jgi:multimeric flavodoxin WrbA
MSPTKRKKSMKKVIIFNASFRKNKGITSFLTDYFIKGIEEAGSQAEVLYLEELNIKHCTGCNNCWFKTPGICTIKNDDMPGILEKLTKADYWVFAVPVYSCWGSSKYKNFLDRLHPIATPELEKHNGHLAHPKRPGYEKAKIVLLSTAGSSIDQFDPLISHLNNFYHISCIELVASILRPMSMVFKRALGNHIDYNVDDIVAAVTLAGQQLIQDDSIAPETLQTISRELMDQDTFLKIYNENIARIFENKKKQAAKNKTSPEI